MRQSLSGRQRSITGKFVFSKELSSDSKSLWLCKYLWTSSHNFMSSERKISGRSELETSYNVTWHMHLEKMTLCFLFKVNSIYRGSLRASIYPSQMKRVCCPKLQFHRKFRNCNFFIPQFPTKQHFWKMVFAPFFTFSVLILKFHLACKTVTNSQDLKYGKK